jgi:uncharacterized protein
VKITDYLPGAPCWVDLGTTDLDGARAFYTELFGWTQHSSPDPVYGGYTIFHLEDEPVAGAGPLMSADQPPAWSWYAATDDAEATAVRVEEAGGKVLAAPFDVGPSGRMAVFTDTSGTPFSIWQSGDFGGARVMGEPGSFGWAELMTRDPDAAAGFFGRVLGWTAVPAEPVDVPHTDFQLDGRSVAGMMSMAGGDWPAELPDHWMVHFSVVDVDDAVRRVKELGGSVAIAPSDTPAGRYAVVGDPAGAWFALVALAE